MQDGVCFDTWIAVLLYDGKANLVCSLMHVRGATFDMGLQAASAL